MIDAPLSNPELILRVCLFMAGTIAVLGGCLQMTLGQPKTEPRLDNVHRFMAGIYLGTGIICLWAGWTIRAQGTLVYLLALGIFFAACGRLLSIAKVGLPQPASVWLAYLAPEIVLPVVMGVAQWMR